MSKGAHKKLPGITSALSALCVALLLAVQIAVSFGHDEQSHPKALEQVCDYCVVKQSLQDIDVAKPTPSTTAPLAPIVTHISRVDLPSFTLIFAFRSRAPPRPQNT